VLQGVEAITTRRTASHDWGDVPEGYLTVAQLQGGDESAGGATFFVSEAAVRETLDTGLFTGLDAARLVFAQKTYAEFLAAGYLRTHEIDVATIQGLMTAAGDPERRVVPELRGVAVWLIRLIPTVLPWMIQSDPELLIRNDIVPVDPRIREQVTASHLRQFEAGGRPKDWSLLAHYGALAFEGLATYLRDYIADDQHHAIAREVAIEIAHACRVPELQDLFVDLALSAATQPTLRIAATRAIAAIGDPDHRLQLKPLAMEDIPEDESDELKAAALEATWPEHLTAQELFAALGPQKIENLIGAYRLFTLKGVREKLPPERISEALDALPRTRRRDMSRPQSAAASGVLWKAFEHIEGPGVLSALARALVQLLTSEMWVFDTSPALEYFERGAPPELSTVQRRRLAAEIIKNVPDREWRIYRLRSARPPFITSEDLPWLIAQLAAAETEVERWAYAKLVRFGFSPEDASQIDAVLTACTWSEHLAEVMRPLTAPVELQSEVEERQRRDHEEDLELEGSGPGEIEPDEIDDASPRGRPGKPSNGKSRVSSTACRRASSRRTGTPTSCSPPGHSGSGSISPSSNAGRGSQSHSSRK
jgi:hypothetical protein